VLQDGAVVRNLQVGCSQVGSAASAEFCSLRVFLAVELDSGILSMK